MGESMKVDIVVVGAGPAGLSFARSLAGSGLSVVVVERQSLAAIAEPAFDGREIALTHASRDILQRLGVWQRFDPADVSELRDAHVLDGDSQAGLRVRALDGQRGQLGWLVPNHGIRKALHALVAGQAGVELLTGAGVSGVVRDDDGVDVTLDDGRCLRARLLVAADSRFSQVRRMLGIGARSFDHGMEMLVCRIAHQHPHGQVALEWFDYGHTLAVLPLNGERSSVVLTLPPEKMRAVMAMDDAAFAADMQRRMRGRLGAVASIGTRHVYPLVSVYADRFAAPRVALIGDTAVGMHPVTAHGFNLGLQGQATLAEVVLKVHRGGGDIGCEAVLARYQRQHRAASWSIYAATRLITRIFTNERPAVRLLRAATLRIANRLPPFRRAIAAHLTQGQGRR